MNKIQSRHVARTYFSLSELIVFIKQHKGCTEIITKKNDEKFSDTLRTVSLTYEYEKLLVYAY